MDDKHELRITGRFEEVRTACQFVADGAEQSGLDEAAVFHVELACDEACTNIIEHAYDSDSPGEIILTWEVEGDSFQVMIHDNGRSFDPADVPTPESGIIAADGRIEDLKVGGLGIHFMRKLMDEVHFEFDREKGNTLIMTKRIPQE